MKTKNQKESRNQKANDAREIYRAWCVNYIKLRQGHAPGVIWAETLGFGLSDVWRTSCMTITKGGRKSIVMIMRDRVAFRSELQFILNTINKLTRDKVFIPEHLYNRALINYEMYLDYDEKAEIMLDVLRH